VSAFEATTADVAERSPLPEAIGVPRIVAIARGLEPDSLARIADGLLAGGVRAFEVTMDSPRALQSIARLAERFAGTPLLIGAGTVLDISAAQAVQAAGARFLVSPHTDPALIRWAAERALPVLPGALTPTEILAAWRAGATAVKLFPASSLGARYLRECRAPYRDIALIPTGGITLESAPAMVAAGAVAVGVGGWLTGDGEPAGIAARGADLVRALADPALRTSDRA
jgi:2-dehydro-3-deoxyphosphogluconate aldolase/(4S)-4-hydroxy-2-oxoglutarate aldolase